MQNETRELPEHRYPSRRLGLQPKDFYTGPAAFPREQNFGNIQIHTTELPERGRYSISITDQKGQKAGITTACARETLPSIINSIREIYRTTRNDPERQIRAMTVKLIMLILAADKAPTVTFQSVPQDTQDDGRWGLRVDDMKMEFRKGSDIVGIIASALSKHAKDVINIPSKPDISPPPVAPLEPVEPQQQQASLKPAGVVVQPTVVRRSSRPTIPASPIQS